MTQIDLGKLRRRVALGRPVVFEGLTVTRGAVFGRTVIFCTDRVNDPIQDRNRGGGFYELEELCEIVRYFPLGGVFVDIGANVGNHSLFFALFGHAASVVRSSRTRLPTGCFSRMWRSMTLAGSWTCSISVLACRTGRRRGSPCRRAKRTSAVRG
jgi:hypothetical protein